MYIKISLILSLVQILIGLTTCNGSNNTSETLILVHALFRHGDRTPDAVNRYPNDPYKHETYFPFGSGQLTNEGKRREYNLGKSLRTQYKKFLGDLYTPGLLDARTTDVDRTKMSLLLVLAGLFPPTGVQDWDPSSSWQPIPYIYEPVKNDKVLSFETACSNFIVFAREHLRSKPVQKISNKYSDIFKYISEHSGWNSTNLFQTFMLYITLETEQEMGLKLPEWTSTIYPKPLQQLASEAYVVLSGTTKLKQIGAGSLLKKILTDTQAKITHQQEKKLYLYSAHELNVALMLNALGVFEPHIPPYGACIVFEVHNVNGEYKIKIFYNNYKSIQTGLLKIPGCEKFCPLKKFISLVERYLPDENVCGKSQ